MMTFLKWLLNPNKGGPNFLFWKKNVRYLRKMIFAFGRFRRRQHLSSMLITKNNSCLYLMKLTPQKFAIFFWNNKTNTIFQFFISSIIDILFLDSVQSAELSQLASKIINQNIFAFKRLATNQVSMVWFHELLFYNIYLIPKAKTPLNFLLVSTKPLMH